MEPRIASTHDFQFIAGSIALDFVNTVGNRLGEARDYFTKPADVSRWARMAAIGELRMRSSDIPTIRRRREYLYSLFLPFARGTHRITTGAVAELNSDLARLVPKRSLQQSEEKFEWIFQGSGGETLAYTVLSDAADLLLSGDCTLIRQCQDVSCGWLYLDRSREKNRRWCSMRDCGNRAKARRYYALHHRRKKP